MRLEHSQVLHWEHAWIITVGNRLFAEQKNTTDQFYSARTL